MKYKKNKKIIKTVKIKVSIKFLKFKNPTDKSNYFFILLLQKKK
jgi:hypothetical protein